MQFNNKTLIFFHPADEDLQGQGEFLQAGRTSQVLPEGSGIS